MRIMTRTECMRRRRMRNANRERSAFVPSRYVNFSSSYSVLKSPVKMAYPIYGATLRTYDSGLIWRSCDATARPAMPVESQIDTIVDISPHCGSR